MAKTGPKRTFNPDREEFAGLYKRMSMKAIAEHYNVGETVVFKRVREFGLKRISRANRLTGKKKSPEHVQNMREAMKGRLSGPDNPNWKGGVCHFNRRLRSTRAFLDWKEAVRSRAGWKCENCGIAHGRQPDGRKIYLHSHHIKPMSEYPDLMHDPDNGKCLCPRCHRKEHNWKTA